MIQLSDVFNMVGVDGCSDVATSLAMQGTNQEISIPIFEIFYLKILPSANSQFIAGSIAEANVLRQLAGCCGGVSCTLNLLDMDILTLAGVLCICTPSTGMNVFFKDNIPDLADLAEDVIAQLAQMAGIPVNIGIGGVGMDIAVQAIDFLFNKLVDCLENNLGSTGIAFRNWDELPDFYDTVCGTGDLGRMKQYRMATHAAFI